MGQVANGILYGCESPCLPGDEDGEGIYGMVEEWNSANGISWRTPGARVRIESDGGKRLLGVWIAVGGSGEDGAPYFVENCIPLAQITTAYAPRIAEATALWDRFVVHFTETTNVQLPRPDLWLTPCEVA